MQPYAPADTRRLPYARASSRSLRENRGCHRIRRAVPPAPDIEPFAMRTHLEPSVKGSADPRRLTLIATPPGPSEHRRWAAHPGAACKLSRLGGRGFFFFLTGPF